MFCIKIEIGWMFLEERVTVIFVFRNYDYYNLGMFSEFRKHL